MNEAHLNNFKEMIPVGELLEEFKADMCERRCIFSLVERSNSIGRICDVILDWGRMRRSNKRLLKAQNDKAWLDVANEIKYGKLNRKIAYERFSDLQADGNLNGMGPAYFTKLIYFLTPEKSSLARGYIMDQWVGCSINEADVVLMDSSAMHKWSEQGDIRPSESYQVSNVNTAENYDNFCCQIEELAKTTSNEPDFAERLLMSKGGRNPLDWRTYVKENRKPFYE